MKNLFCLFALLALSHTAHAAKWEYQTVRYENLEKFEPLLKTLGEQGWELTGCPTSGNTPYGATISGANGGSFTGYIGRTVYCFFKRELP